MQPLLWSLINKSYTHCPQGEKDVEINVLLFFSLFTAPLTDKPPKILFPSESQMSIIEMAIGKKTRPIPFIDGLISVRRQNMCCHGSICLLVINGTA